VNSTQKPPGSRRDFLKATSQFAAASARSTRLAGMNRRQTLLTLVAAMCFGWLCGCATRSGARCNQQTGESFAFVGEQSAALAQRPAPGQPFHLRSTYLPGTDTAEYQAGCDFVVNFTNGMVRRASDSRIPDFRTNVLYGQPEFDHSRFPGFGNTRPFCFRRLYLRRIRALAGSGLASSIPLTNPGETGSRQTGEDPGVRRQYPRRRRHRPARTDLLAATDR